MEVTFENTGNAPLTVDNVTVPNGFSVAPGSTARAIVGSPWGGSNDTVDKVQVSKVRPMRRMIIS